MIRQLALLVSLVALTSMSFAQQLKLRLLETTIAFYEPRISSVIVTMQPVAGGQRVLRFQIEGLLQVEPAPERVLFDTTLELASGQYTVEGEPGAR